MATLLTYEIVLHLLTALWTVPETSVIIPNTSVDRKMNRQL